jgi:hypothetical protein
MRKIIKKHNFSDFAYANIYPVFMYPMVVTLWALVLVEMVLSRRYFVSGDYFQYFYMTLYHLCFGVIFIIVFTTFVMGVIFLLGSLKHTSQSEISYDEQSIVIKVKNAERTYPWNEVKECLTSKNRLFISFKDLIHFHLSKKGISEGDWNDLLSVLANRSKIDKHFLPILNLFLMGVVVLWIILKIFSLSS